MTEDKVTLVPGGGLRDNRTGKFVPGHKGPGKHHISALRQALSGAVTVQDCHDIMRKMVALAKEGSIDAAKLVFDRLFGRMPNNLKLVEDKSVSVNIRNLSEEELQELEAMALRAAVPPTLEAEATVKGEDD